MASNRDLEFVAAGMTRSTTTSNSVKASRTCRHARQFSISHNRVNRGNLTLDDSKAVTPLGKRQILANPDVSVSNPLGMEYKDVGVRGVVEQTLLLGRRKAFEPGRLWKRRIVTNAIMLRIGKQTISVFVIMILDGQSSRSPFKVTVKSKKSNEKQSKQSIKMITLNLCICSMLFLLASERAIISCSVANSNCLTIQLSSSIIVSD